MKSQTSITQMKARRRKRQLSEEKISAINQNILNDFAQSRHFVSDSCERVAFGLPTLRTSKILGRTGHHVRLKIT